MSKTKTKTPSFDEALAKFQKVQESYVSWGAWDTEPRAIFRSLIEATYEGREVEVPTTATGWQLYSDMQGVGLAAHALTKAARRAITAAQHDTLGVARYVRDCW